MSEALPYEILAAQPQTDSLAPLVRYVEVRFPIPLEGDGDTSDDRSFHSLPAHDVLQSIQITHVLGGAVPAGVIHLFFRWEDRDREFLPSRPDVDPTVLTQAELMDRVIPFTGAELNLQWNWDRAADSVDAFTRAPFYRFDVKQVRTQFTPAGMGVTLEVTMVLPTGMVGGITSGYYIPSFIKQAFAKNQTVGDPADATVNYDGPKSWEEGWRASEIVADIADFYGWAYAVGSSGDGATIEESDPVLPEMTMLADETHLDFIIKRLLPLSKNVYEEAFVCYFDRDDVLHFHSRHFYGIYVARAYRAYRDKMGEVISFEPTDDTLFAMTGGGSGTHVSILSADGETMQQNADIATGVDGKGKGRVPEEYGGYVTNPKVGIYNPSKDKTELWGPTPLIPTKGRTAEEAATRAAVINNCLAFNMYLATMEVRGTHKVQAGDFIVVEYYTSGTDTDVGNLYYLSGLYQVQEVTHRVDRTWTTSFLLNRSGYAVPPYSVDIDEGRVLPVGVEQDETIPATPGEDTGSGTIGVVFLPEAVYDP